MLRQHSLSVLNYRQHVLCGSEPLLSGLGSLREHKARRSPQEQGCAGTGNSPQAACASSSPPNTDDDHRANPTPSKGEPQPSEQVLQQGSQSGTQQESHTAGHAQGSRQGGSAGSEKVPPCFDTCTETLPSHRFTPSSSPQSCDKREDQTAGQAHSSSQGGLTGSEQGLRCLDITTETRLGRDHHTQRSRVAHAHAAAQRRNTHADELPTVASNSQHAPHRAQGHLSERSAQPGRLMAAAQKAKLAHGRFYRASALLQKRDKLTRPSLATVEDVPAAARASASSVSPPSSKALCRWLSCVKPVLHYNCTYGAPRSSSAQDASAAVQTLDLP